ncbi:MAG: DinB family protein [Candidatus Kapabacteria bacterium]|nr:DinB family protein [Candidatus Kapabacteria bacterium]
MTPITHRRGKVGVLLHEYHRSIADLKQTIAAVQPGELRVVLDKETMNRNCVSIGSVLAHIVFCGLMYCTTIRQHRGNPDEQFEPLALLDTVEEYNAALDRMFDITRELFEDIPDSELMEFDPAKKLQTYWGQLYDIEQLMEHAIVHILRHRFMIERFMAMLPARES